MINKQQYLKFWQILKKHDNYLITAHIHPDGDSICSSILFASILKSFKKKYYILMEDLFPEKFKFLINNYADLLIPELINIPQNKDLKELLPGSFKPESVIILDACGIDRLGEFSEYFSDLKVKLNIDHHSGIRTFQSRDDLIDTNASAAGEIIYYLMKANRFKITPEIAELIYISVITDTNSFSQSNTTAATHFMVSELLKTGIKPEEIHFYFSEQPAEAIQIFGKVTARLKLKYNNKLAWSYILKSELDRCPDSDVGGLIETIRNVKDTRAAVLFKEVNKNMTKVNLRGKKGFNVRRIARKFNGGGHIQASGFNYNEGLNKSIKILLNKFKKYF